MTVTEATCASCQLIRDFDILDPEFLTTGRIEYVCTRCKTANTHGNEVA